MRKPNTIHSLREPNKSIIYCEIADIYNYIEKLFVFRQRARRVEMFQV